MRHPWTARAGVCVLCVDALVLSEWLFFATKPSFMSVLDGVQRTMVLLVSPLPLLLLSALVLLLLRLIVLLDDRPWAARVGAIGSRMLPALLLGILFVLLVDNFTYTVFGFGIRTSAGAGRVVYAVVWVALLAGAYLAVSRLERRLAALPRRWLLWIAGGLPAISVLAGAVSLATRHAEAHASALRPPLARQPNILLLGCDGLNADHLSAYGYARATTPTLEALAPRTLFCENALSNSAHTGSSIASMLTGRLPTRTRLIYPPDILTGEDVYRHLPAILKRYGYRTADISVRHFADPFDLNLRQGFDEANGRPMDPFQSSQRLSRLLGQETSYFVEQVSDRVEGRLLHAFGVRDMNRAFEEVTGSEHARVTDAVRLEQLLSFVDASDRPFFAHVHFLATHGPRYWAERQVYSAGQQQDENFMVDFYDDAILTYDHMVDVVVRHLESQGKLDDTVIVFNSDHGRFFVTNRRIPLMFLFAGGEHAGRITTNVQNLDVSPTLLDYLGVPVPDWMEGTSLLRGPPDPLRPIFSARRSPDGKSDEDDSRGIDAEREEPPFYSLGSLRLVLCNRTYLWRRTFHDVVIGEIPGHTAPCPATGLPSDDEAERWMFEHLAAAGYDVRGIHLPLPKIYRDTSRIEP